MISAILLAAGQSKRMRGENKILKKYKKKYLINHILKSLINLFKQPLFMYSSINVFYY